MNILTAIYRHSSNRGLLILIFGVLCLDAAAQETLQTVTDRNNSTTKFIKSTSQLGFRNSSNGYNWDWGVVDLDGSWRLNNTGVINAITVLSPSGNVGIGTSNTSGFKLAVAGGMIAESVKVQLQSTWPDYVFTKSYQLPTIQEAEKHILEKGHLAGIPSAKEIENNGIDLGEMNVKLLKKIEELTLYLIQQNKAIEAQASALAAQQREIDQLKLKK